MPKRLYLESPHYKFGSDCLVYIGHYVKALVVRSCFIHFTDGFAADSVIACVLRYLLRILYFIAAKAIYWTTAFLLRILSLAARNKCLDRAISAFYWPKSQQNLNISVVSLPK